MTNHIRDWIPMGDMVAWVDPEGRIHTVDYYEHLEFFKGHPDLGHLWDELQTALEDNQEEIDQAMFDLEPGEHPAMHRFAFMDDEDRSNMYLQVYQAGWCRLGVYTHKYRKRNHYLIEVYGTPEHLENYRKILKKLGQELEGKVRFYVVKETNDWRSYAKFEAKMEKVYESKKGLVV